MSKLTEEAKAVAEQLRIAAAFHDLQEPKRNNDGETMREAARLLDELAWMREEAES